MRKAQGLPLNFIVLAAMAILILVLVVAFVLMGRQSLQSSMTPSAIKSTCDGYCQRINNWAANQEQDDDTINDLEPDDFCSKTFAISSTNTVRCTSSTVGASCIVNFNDGTSCGVTCSDNKPVCVGAGED